MHNSIRKEIVNFILVIVFTFIYVFFAIPMINSIAGNRLLGIGLWSTIVGIWGNLVGLRLVKPLVFLKNTKQENYVFIAIGVMLILVGVILSIV